LLRKYGFDFNELIFSQGNLSLKTDPKTLWALAHPERFPVEVNRAEKAELLRIPGIGPVLAKRIIENRRDNKLTDAAQLKKMGVMQKTLPFILLNGKIAEVSRQLDLFGSA